MQCLNKQNSPISLEAALTLMLLWSKQSANRRQRSSEQLPKQLKGTARMPTLQRRPRLIPVLQPPVPQVALQMSLLPVACYDAPASDPTPVAWRVLGRRPLEIGSGANVHLGAEQQALRPQPLGRCLLWASGDGPIPILPLSIVLLSSSLFASKYADLVPTRLLPGVGDVFGFNCPIPAPGLQGYRHRPYPKVIRSHGHNIAPSGTTPTLPTTKLFEATRTPL